MVDNFDVEYKNAAGRPGVKLVAPAEDPRNKRMIDVLIKKYPITVMNEPRPGKRLLVLDLDYSEYKP
jgi:ubiquitin-like domain-containing CTD phosphatase 1